MGLASEWKRVTDLRYSDGRAVELFFSDLKKEFKVRVHSLDDDRMEEETFGACPYNQMPAVQSMELQDMQQLTGAIKRMIEKLKP